YPGHVAESSVYTKASVHPLITGSLLAGLGFAAFMAWRALSEPGQYRNAVASGPRDASDTRADPALPRYGTDDPIHAGSSS
ncbi:MAG TPA: hypothetical protein VJT69_14395, partial [Pyrinomonadaceae bacterium]|nr:hypothetical protein [Pyrinomonadaceae bacterium]